MQYLMLDWDEPAEEDDPCRVYVQLDGHRREVRRIDMYRNGTYILWDEGAAELKPEPYPDNIYSLPGAPMVQRLSAVQFESYWAEIKDMQCRPMDIFF